MAYSWRATRFDALRHTCNRHRFLRQNAPDFVAGKKPPTDKRLCDSCDLSAIALYDLQGACLELPQRLVDAAPGTRVEAELLERVVRIVEVDQLVVPVCTENLIRVDAVMESRKLTE